jgi:two-component system, OmpR family, copper resistance phosphate regulon response regulator CusR
VVLDTRILVVEDERTLASFIEHGLPTERHAVTSATTVSAAEAAALTGDYALVLLDLLCPVDRAPHSWSDPRGCRNLPVIVLTMRAAVEQKGVSTEARTTR